MSDKQHETKKLTKLEKIEMSRDNIEKKAMANKKAKANTSIKESNIIKYLKIILFIAVLIIVFYPPYLKGLYFETQQLPSEIFVFIVFAAFWVYRIMKRDRRFLETPVDYASFGFVIVYLISILGAVSLRLAIAEWLKYCMYFAVFFMLSELADSYKSRVMVLWVIVASAVGVSILGIDAAAGGYIADVLKPVLTGIGAPADMFMSLYQNGRIYSTLQYPNTLAAYLMAAFFISLGLTIASSKLWKKLVAGAASFILLVTFIATLSRGAYILLPIAAVIFLISLPKGNRIKGAVYGLGMAIAVGIVSIKFLEYISTPIGNEMKIWAFILAGIALSALSVILVSYIVISLEKVNWKVYTGIISALAFAALVVTLYILNADIPLELSNEANKANTANVVVKSAVLKPGNEYKLQFNVNASATEDKLYSYEVGVLNLTEKDILFNKQTLLSSTSEKETQGIKKREVFFTVPEDSRVVRFYFVNSYAGTKAVFNNAKVVDASTGKVVKNIKLKYKYFDSVISRFETLSADFSGIQRSVYNKDALKMIKDRWFIGAGGGAWPILYFSYQSYLYWTTQAHNYFLQLGIETGIIGVIVLILTLIAMLLTYLFYYFRKKEDGESEKGILTAAVITAIAALSMHSAIDFDLSLSAVFLLLWELIAVLNAAYKEKAREGMLDSQFTVLSKVFKLKNITQSLKIKPVIGLVATIAILIVPVLFASAKAYSAEASKALEAKNIDMAINYFKKASSLDQFRPEYKIDHANLLIRKNKVSKEDIDEATAQMIKAESLCKYDVNLTPNLGSYYLSVGNAEKGLDLFRRTTTLRPFNPADWQQRVNAYFKVIGSYFNKRNDAIAMKYITEALSVINEAKAVNKGNMDPFMFNISTDEMLEKLKYVKDNFSSGDKININKITFYNMPDMDINSDGMPDQWTVSNERIKLSNNNGILQITNKNSQNNDYIQTRKLNLLPGKQYHIEVQLQNYANIKSIPFLVAGIDQLPNQLTLLEDKFVSDFKSPEDNKNTDYYLRLFISDNYQIKNIKIVNE